MFESEIKFKTKKDKSLFDSESEIQELIQSKLKNVKKSSEIPRYIDRYHVEHDNLGEFFTKDVIKDLLSSEIREFLGLEKIKTIPISFAHEDFNDENEDCENFDEDCEKNDNEEYKEDDNEEELFEDKIDDSCDSSESYSI